jgi:RNA polymerase-binding transcription factor DksA
MEKQLLEKFKMTLEKEKAEITKELSEIATRNKEDPSEWKSKFAPSESETGHEAREIAADESEEYGEQLPVARVLAQKLADIDAALGRIAAGTYGECHYCGYDIPLERLEALPTAKACPDCCGIIGE